MNINNRDAELDLCIQKVAKGDTDSFKTLYDALYKPIFFFALTIVNDRHIAEDVSQDTFLNLFISANTYRPGTKPRAWIYSIARNAAITALKNSRNNIFLSLDEVDDTISDDTADLFEVNSIDGIEAMSILTKEERQIIVLYVYAGFRQTEISKILNMPYITVRSHYGYAIKKLKRYYGQLGGKIL